MDKISSLTSPSDFEKVFQSGLKVSNRYIVVRYLTRGESEKNRVAFLTGKRIGNAVSRNRIKRLLRESYRRNVNKVARGYDIVIIARSSLKDRTYWETEKSLLEVLRAGGLVSRTSPPK